MLELPVTTAVKLVQVIVCGGPTYIFGNAVLEITATVLVEKQPVVGFVTFNV